MVECNLAKVEVGGSNPLSRSIFPIDSLGLKNLHRVGPGGLLRVRVRIGCRFAAGKVVNEGPVGTWDQVTIAFNGEFDRAVPQLLTDVGNRCTVSQQETCKGVSEVMETKATQSCLF